MEPTRQSSAHAGLAGEVVEHQHAVASPVGADLEAGPVGRERVGTAGPRPGGLRLRGTLVMVAVVEDDLEHPVVVVRSLAARMHDFGVGRQLAAVRCGTRLPYRIRFG